MSSNADYGGGRPGPDKKCRACYDYKTWLKINAKPAAEETNKAEDGSSTEKAKTDQASSSSQAGAESVNAAGETCPLDKDSLGKCTWGLIHTMAANYPVKVSASDQQQMNSFIHLFARFYPCNFCAEDLRKYIEKNPPETQNQDSLSQWWCRAHNEVNLKLGKPVFDCSKVYERWRDGWKDGSCG